MEKISQKDPDFAEKFIKQKLILIAKEAKEVGIPADEFEALVINLTDELNFKDIL